LKNLIILFAILSTLLQLIAIVRGHVKAPRASWLIWFIIGVVWLIVNYSFNGWDSASTMLASLAVGNLLIVFYVLKKNPHGWTRRETKLLIATIIIIAIWLPFKLYSERQALLWATAASQLLLLSAHFIGVWNHWQKVWSDPFTESVSSWTCRFLSAGIALVLLIQQHQTIAVMISPIYGTATTVILLSLIFRRRFQLRQLA
jgi:hypothetical protein